MAAKPLVDPNIRSRTAFIAVGGSKRNPTYTPVPWHLVEYALQTGVTGGKVIQLWEPVDIEVNATKGLKARESNKVVTRIEFVNEDSLYIQRPTHPGSELSIEKGRRGVNGGNAFRHPARTL